MRPAAEPHVVRNKRPQPWYDSKVRVVSLEALRRICDDVSGTVHRYRVVAETKHRVTVEYSNPDEYGVERPIRAQFPCYSMSGMVCVVLDYVRVTGDPDDYLWQQFELIRFYEGDCNPNTTHRRAG